MKEKTTDNADVPGMLASVGGSPDGQVASITQLKPRFVVFLVSQRSVENIHVIVERCRAEGADFMFKSSITENEQELQPCYDAAVKAHGYVLEEGLSPDEVVADYTGGTKQMSAAITLCAEHFGYRFLYVGGAARDITGTGRVEKGSEKLYQGPMPWQEDERSAKKRLALHFNGYRFTSAMAEADVLAGMVLDARSEIFRSLSRIIEGYDAWDLFRHKEAYGLITSGRNALEPQLKLGLTEDTAVLGPFLRRVKNNVNRLRSLVGGDEKGVSINLITDVLKNADRRSQEGRFDDAVARLYRVLEMVGQHAFHERFGISNGNVPAEKLPAEWAASNQTEKYRSRDTEHLMLPMYATFSVLAHIGDEVGKAFIESEDVKSLLYVRNNSILAHGTLAVSGDHFRQLRQIVTDLSQGLDLNEMHYTFPTIGW